MQITWGHMTLHADHMWSHEIAYRSHDAANHMMYTYHMLVFLSLLQFLKIYLHVFIFVGVNLGLQLFVGIVVTNFNEHKPDHSALLSVSQKRWTDLMQSITLTRPIKCPPQPSR